MSNQQLPLLNPELLQSVAQTAGNIVQNMNIPESSSGGMPDVGNLMNEIMGNIMNNDDIKKNIEETAKSFNPETTEENNDESHDIHISLDCPLEDFYHGKTKKIRVKRKRMGKNGNLVKDKKVFKIKVKPGMEDGQTITLSKEGDEYDSGEYGDLVVTLLQIPHPVFERNGGHLIIEKDISIYESFNCHFTIVTLTGKEINIKSDPGDILHLEGCRKVKGFGMPCSNGFGDLYIKFNVTLPESVENPEQLKELFPPINKLKEGESHSLIKLDEEEMMFDSESDSMEELSETDLTDNSEHSEESKIEEIEEIEEIDEIDES